MRPIEEIKKFLNNYPYLRFKESSNSIIVYSDNLNGFTVSLKVWKNGYILSYGRWHEYFPKTNAGANIAMILFKFGISDSCRLKVYKKGNIDYKCELYYRDWKHNKWIRVATQSKLIYPFWEKEQKEHLSNKIVEGEQITNLFDSSEFEKVITEVKYERRYAKYALIYISLWIGIFLKLNKFNIHNIQTSFIMFSPAIFIIFLLPILAMRNWFDDRKYGKSKRLILSRRQRNFLFIWLSLWFLGFLIIYALWGIENLIPLFVIFFPFMLVAFCIPIYLMMQKK